MQRMCYVPVFVCLLWVAQGSVQSYSPCCDNVHSHSSTPQSPSVPYRFCPLLSSFEYVDRRTCRSMYWAWASPLSPSKLPLYVWGSTPQLIHGSLAHSSSQSKQYLERFRRFCTVHDALCQLKSCELLRNCTLPITLSDLGGYSDCLKHG